MNVIKGKKKKLAEQELATKIALFEKLPDHCLTCEIAFDKMNKADQNAAKATRKPRLKQPKMSDQQRRDYIKLGGAALAGAIVVGGGLQAFAPRTITETVTETEKQTITKTAEAVTQTQVLEADYLEGAYGDRYTKLSGPAADTLVFNGWPQLSPEDIYLPSALNSTAVPKPATGGPAKICILAEAISLLNAEVPPVESILKS